MPAGFPKNVFDRFFFFFKVPTSSSQQRRTPRLSGAAVVEIGRFFRGTQFETKSNPQLNVCTSLVDSYGASQAASTRRNEGRPWWGV